MTPKVAILGIGKALPNNRISQTAASELITSSMQDRPDLARFARRVFKSCGVETRYTCEPEYTKSFADCRYFHFSNQQSVPSTNERMLIYRRESVPLGLEAAEAALLDSKIERTEITHLITVSCTGQFLPGLDVSLIKQLGLSARVNRIPLIFQGCAAGLKAIQMARDIVQGSPDSKVLIVCVELCSLHFQPVMDKESLYAAAFFGDGAAGCVIGDAKNHRQSYFKLGRGYAALLPDSTSDMTWDVGNTGFDLYLSPQIPKQLSRHLAPELEYLLDGDELPELWAIHPGGKGIVDSVQKMLGLRDDQTKYSRNILRHAGNLSSVTILFVLYAMRQELQEKKEETSKGVAMAFGPGLTAELMEFTYVKAHIPSKWENPYVHV